MQVNRRYVLCSIMLQSAGRATYSSLGTLSSTEVEYITASAATREATFLGQLLQHMGEKQSSPTGMFVDNILKILIVKGPRTKHIELRYHYIRSVLNY
jgi:hypothetical protein